MPPEASTPRERLLDWAPCLLALALMALAAPHTIDDAYISFRYAEQLLAGEGLVFNAGERIEGFTNPSWTLASALWGVLGIPFAVGAKLVGAAALGLALRESARFARRRGLELRAGAWMAALCFPLAAHSVMGLETGAYAALLWIASLRTFAALDVEGETGPNPRVTGVLWFLAMWSRPETPLFFAWVSLGCLYRRRLELFARPWLLAAGGLVLGGVSLLVFRFIYYGDLLPNTYYAKTGGDMLGVPGTGAAYLRAFGEAWWPWAPLVGLGAAAAWTRDTLRPVVVAVVPMLLSWLAYVQSVGGDWMLQWRFVVPVFLPAAFVAGALFEWLWARARGTKIVAGALLLAVLLHAGAQVQQGRQDVETQIVEWAELVEPPVAWLETQPPGSVAVGDIGWIAFATKRRIVDFIGLIDRDIARASGGYANKDREVIARRVFEQKVDYIIVMAALDCTQPGYPALRALTLPTRDELWRDYALAEVFSLGKDGINCVFRRLGPLGEPAWLERFDADPAPGWELEGGMRIAHGASQQLPAFDGDARGGYLTTWTARNGGADHGMARSPVLEPEGAYLRFELAGGGDPGVRVELLDADSGEVLRRVGGRGDYRMRTVYWEVGPLASRRLRVQVVDESSGSFGMLFVDDFAWFDEVGGD